MTSPTQTITAPQPHAQDPEAWSAWFWERFFPEWYARVQDGEDGVFDALNEAGDPDMSATKSLLAQARTLFTLSHVALASKDPMIVEAARKQAAFLQRFHKGNGLYRATASRDGSPTGRDEDAVARSYDHSFIILGLVTWNRISPSGETAAQIDACWTALQTTLTDPITGLLRNDDTEAISNPAQNPHMHLFEACLQAYRMTGEQVWRTRAAELRATGLEHFIDRHSGSLTEFLTPALQPLPGAEGERREPGHQCEWAWLLWEEADLAQAPALGAPAARLMDFADRYCFAKGGLFDGAAFDAVSANGEVMEHSFLLWPQTEAIKALALRHTAGDADAGPRAQALMCLMFERWFKDRPTYVNRLDPEGKTLWNEALTRLMYHIVIAMTEGARAGLWAGIPLRKT
jgi:mannose-6-phosphate isomerase